MRRAGRPEWTTLQDLDYVGADQPVGFWGVSLGSAIGIPLAAADRRITVSVFGLVGHESLTEAAARVTIPVEFCCSGTTSWCRATRLWTVQLASRCASSAARTARRAASASVARLQSSSGVITNLGGAHLGGGAHLVNASLVDAQLISADLPEGNSAAQTSPALTLPARTSATRTSLAQSLFAASGSRQG